MSDNLIGGQITRYRKALGMTQEELGRAVGVSTQAVSRWECGGAPDVTLLPAIADRLHITVDTLFGREGGAPVDIQTVVLQWLLSLPDGSADEPAVPAAVGTAQKCGKPAGRSAEYRLSEALRNGEYL